MSKKKPTRAPGDDAQFESFLKQQFATLRSEIDAQATKGAAKSGKRLEMLPPRNQTRGGSAFGLLDKWKYGIAAVVVVAVAVPSVMQLNRQKAEATLHTSAPALEQEQKSSKTLQDRIADREEADADATPRSGKIEANKNYYGKKTKAAPAKDARDAEISDDAKGRRDKREDAPRAPAELAAGRSEGYVTKEETPARERARMQDAPAATRSSETQAITAAPAEKAERSVSAGAPAASPAPAPVFAAKKRSTAPSAAQPRAGAETEAKRDAASMASADEAPAAKPRSFSLDDTNAKLKKQSAADEEKAEMEKLWKEYEKNPQAFNKDANRSARLRTLLARHDTKSRAKRMITK